MTATRAHRGATVWLTGLPAAGKSTVAAGLERQLLTREVHVLRLDGDVLREGLCADLGFDAASREENVRRVAHVAKLFAGCGAIAIVSLISPYASHRAKARELHERDGLPFLEVWVNTALAECERRDPKGLYARARRGELSAMTGVDDPYEPPEACDVEVRADVQTPAACVAQVLEALVPRALTPVATASSA